MPNLQNGDKGRIRIRAHLIATPAFYCIAIVLHVTGYPYSTLVEFEVVIMLVIRYTLYCHYVHFGRFFCARCKLLFWLALLFIPQRERYWLTTSMFMCG